MSTYFAIWTTVGLARLADAVATSTPIVFSKLAVGDGNGSPITPLASMTSLVHETARVDINAVDIDPDNANQVRIEGLIDASTGGFTIREAGLFNDANELIAIASYPPIYKPQLSDGVSVQEYIRILLQYSDPTTAITISADTSVIIATRQYVDERVREIYGDGSDGDCVLDGTNTFSWASKVGSVYTLTRDVFFTNLTLSGAAVTLKTANHRIYGTGILTTNGGKISSSGGSTFTAVSGATLIGGTNGGTPAATGVGPAGTAQSVAGYSGQGGAGGTGSGGAGGAAGSVSADTDTSRLRAYSPASLGARMVLGVMSGYGGGSGGGGGGGNGSSVGTVGGSGAGVLTIAFRYVVLSSASDLQAAGTNGPAATNANTGGGGGGGGGTVVLVRETLHVNDSSAITAANCAPGGSGGAGNGTGTAGSAGSNGTAIDIEMKLSP